MGWVPRPGAAARTSRDKRGNCRISGSIKVQVHVEANEDGQPCQEFRVGGVSLETTGESLTEQVMGAHHDRTPKNTACGRVTIANDLIDRPRNAP